MPPFADEVAQARRMPEAPEAVPEAPAEEPAADDVPPFPKDGDPALPAGAAPVDPKAKEAEEAAKAAAEAAKPPVEEAKPKIKIGDKEFDTVEQAVEYAKELEQARREDQAFIDGVKTAKGKEAEAEKPPQKTIDEIVEEKIFEDPKAAIKELREAIKKEMWDEYSQMTAQEKAVAQQKAESERMWNDFYTGNPELSESKEVVNFLVQKNWDKLKDLPHQKALDQVAEMARTQLKITKEATLPKKELQSGPVTTAGVSSTATTQQKSTDGEEKLSFTDQLKKLRTRK